MPEGHTLHRLAGALDAAFAGTAPRVSSPQGRFAAGAALLDGRRMLAASSWGKHLFAQFEEERWLGIHLGLVGTLSIDPYEGYAGPPPVWGQVRLRLLTDSHVADLRGATGCAVLAPEQVDAVLARLGPDPLRPAEADVDRAWQRIARSSRSIAELLIDQSILAGVGNVYRCELLFRHRVAPFTAGAGLRRRTWQAMWEDLVVIMPLGVAFNQILTMADQVEQAAGLVAAGRVPTRLAVHTDAARSAGSALGPGAAMPRQYYVYRRAGEPCHVCGSRIRTQVVAGRSLFWCGRCQRRR